MYEFVLINESTQPSRYSLNDHSFSLSGKDKIEIKDLAGGHVAFQKLEGTPVGISIVKDNGTKTLYLEFGSILFKGGTFTKDFQLDPNDTKGSFTFHVDKALPGIVGIDDLRDMRMKHEYQFLLNMEPISMQTNNGSLRITTVLKDPGVPVDLPWYKTKVQ